eukprot:COSAG01_NODE_4477_length_4987_cov_42.965630_8_plen_58_part_00
MTEIYLCHACSDHEIVAPTQVLTARRGYYDPRSPRVGALPPLQPRRRGLVVADGLNC